MELSMVENAAKTDQLWIAHILSINVDNTVDLHHLM